MIIRDTISEDPEKGQDIGIGWKGMIGFTITAQLVDRKIGFVSIREISSPTFHFCAVLTFEDSSPHMFFCLAKGQFRYSRSLITIEASRHTWS
jgi:hypothetical protein